MEIVLSAHFLNGCVQDGYPDIVASGPGAPSLWVYTSDGGSPPNFSPTPIATTFAFTGMSAAVGDVNGDGALDVAFTISTVAGNSWLVPWVTLLTNLNISRGSLTFSSSVLASCYDCSGTSVVFFDLDGDGNLDIIAGLTGNDGYSGFMQWFRSDGARPNPHFANPVTVSSAQWSLGGRGILSPSIVDMVSGFTGSPCVDMCRDSSSWCVRQSVTGSCACVRLGHRRASAQCSVTPVGMRHRGGSSVHL